MLITSSATSSNVWPLAFSLLRLEADAADSIRKEEEEEEEANGAAADVMAIST
jgi:hypothetical protein